MGRNRFCAGGGRRGGKGVRSVRQIYNAVLLERIPDDMRALLEKLK